jgi:putative oxidoreductase
MGVAGVLEFFGGLLILVGLFTRPVAFILSGQMAVAYFMAHAPRGIFADRGTEAS